MNECIFDIDPKLLSLASEAENECREMFEKIDSNAEYNGQKVLKAFIDNRVSEGCLKGTTGYGYGDMGRDTIDKVFAQALGGEDALVRHTFVNGTHALSTALFGVLRSGDTMLACTGKPYDTLEEIIGIRGEKGNGSLIDFGVKYEQVDLVDEMYPDYDEIAKKAVGAKIAYIQRSRGYSLRPSLTVEIIGKIAETAKKANPDIIVMVDNCYGEFVERKEPLSVGADIIIGSLIKIQAVELLLQADISAAEQTLWKSVQTGSPVLAWARRSAVHLIRTEKCSLAFLSTAGGRISTENFCFRLPFL